MLPSYPSDHAKLIEPEPGVTEWTELAGRSDIAGFYPFVIGVFANCGTNGYRPCDPSGMADLFEAESG